MTFTDREEAGRRLAERLAGLGLTDVVVLALPRGGVPVAFEVARALRAPLDVLVVRKIGAPQQPELGVGAVAEGGAPLLDGRMLARLGRTPADLEPVIARELAEVERRVRHYRGGREPVEVAGRTVVLVDDGLATGSTARAGLRSLRQRGASRLVLAVPVCAQDTVRRLTEEADDIVCVLSPSDFRAVGAWYDRFDQTSDEVVLELLRRAREPVGPVQQGVRIPAGGVELEGDLSVPAGARGVVVFAHGSGSGRHSPRNRQVAAALREAGLGTLLLDLLTAEEGVLDARTRGLRFDIPLLAGRLGGTVDWLAGRDDLRGVAVGVFGASTGAGAALLAAAERPDVIRAVVSRGGRPDLAGSALARVRAPTLLVVGGDDRAVLELNRQALGVLGGRVGRDTGGRVGRDAGGEGRLELVPGAGHLFEEPGALDRVVELATSWFLRHLGGRS